MSNQPDIIGSLATPEERRAGVQRAYDDGYEDGRLDVDKESFERGRVHQKHQSDVYAMEVEMERDAALAEVAGLNDQVDYWRNEFLRLNAVLELQVQQADEVVDEAYLEGYGDGRERGYNDCLDGNFS